MRRLPIILVAAVACSSSASKQTHDPGADAGTHLPTTRDARTSTGENSQTISDAATTEVVSDATVPEPLAPFAANIRSLELTRSIAVRTEPRKKAERYGTIAARTRVAWKRVLKNDECSKRWVEIQPYGWICEYYLRPSEKPPEGVEVPRLEREELVPGVYGKITAELPMTYHRQKLTEEQI